MRKLESCREKRHMWAKLYILKVQEIQSLLHCCQVAEPKNEQNNSKLDINKFFGGQFFCLRAPKLVKSGQKRDQKNLSNYFQSFQGQFGQEVIFLNCEIGFELKFSSQTPQRIPTRLGRIHFCIWKNCFSHWPGNLDETWATVILSL